MSLQYSKYEVDFKKTIVLDKKKHIDKSFSKKRKTNCKKYNKVEPKKKPKNDNEIVLRL